MASPEDYIEQIKSLGMEDLELTGSTISEAKRSLSICDDLEQKLQHIANSVAMEINLIEEEFEERLSSESVDESKKFLFFRKKSNTDSNYLLAKEKLLKEKELTILPYNLVVKHIIGLTDQLKQSKKQLNIFILESK